LTVGTGGGRIIVAVPTSPITPWVVPPLTTACPPTGPEVSFPAYPAAALQPAQRFIASTTTLSASELPRPIPLQKAQIRSTPVS